MTSSVRARPGIFARVGCKRVLEDSVRLDVLSHKKFLVDRRIVPALLQGDVERQAHK
jgi:hypothetical protein